MQTTKLTRRGLLAAGAAMPLAAGLAACSSNDPLSEPSSTGSGSATGALTVGSANFAESEIIGELYAQALEAKGLTVTRKMQIGAREVYLGALKDGSIDLIAEYSGNLLGYYDKSAAAKTSEEIITALAQQLPAELAVLEAAQAEDKDSYNVTAAFSQEHGITSLEQLAGYSGTLRIGGNPELAERDYGLQGLVTQYGVVAERIQFTPISDGGGPLTVRALTQGDIDIANIFSTSPAIKANQLVTLADPKNMITAQNIVPLISKAKLNEQVETTINAVQAKLTTDDLVAMNEKNVGDAKMQPAKIAAEWLKEKGLV